MKTRPILFNKPMVRALLNGTKTQTRRVVTQQPETGTDCPYHVGIGADRKARVCPYGRVGDRLWVRETWGAHFIWDDVPPSEIPNDGKECLFYRADGFSTGRCSQTQRDKWRPSIHMPRWASRITLEIVGVRVERLQDISEQDAWAEGCEGFDDDVTGGKSGYSEYAELWESINGPGSWDVNPWVWVVEFKRVSQ